MNRDYEWLLSADNMRFIFQTWGRGVTHLDLFAICRMKKCQVSCSKAAQNPGFLIDAFVLSTKDELMYAYPPIRPLPIGVFRLNLGRACIIFILSAWPYQHWFFRLLSLSTRALLTLPPERKLGSQDHGHWLYPNQVALHLMAWTLYG